jgi:hypothetical protein
MLLWYRHSDPDRGHKTRMILDKVRKSTPVENEYQVDVRTGVLRWTPGRSTLFRFADPDVAAMNPESGFAMCNLNGKR